MIGQREELNTVQLQHTASDNPTGSWDGPNLDLSGLRIPVPVTLRALLLGSGCNLG